MKPVSARKMALSGNGPDADHGLDSPSTSAMKTATSSVPSVQRAEQARYSLCRKPTPDAASSHEISRPVAEGAQAVLRGIGSRLTSLAIKRLKIRRG